MNKILTDQTWASIASEIRIKASYMRLATQQLQCVVWSVRLCITFASTIMSDAWHQWMLNADQGFSINSRQYEYVGAYLR